MTLWRKRVVAAAILAMGFTAARAQQAAEQPGALTVLVQTLARMENPAVQANILRGLNASLKGKRNLSAPPGWNELYDKLQRSSNQEVRREAQALAAAFGGGAALAEFRKTLADSNAGLEARKTALDSLVAAKDADALPSLLSLVGGPNPLRAAALRGLSNYDDPRLAPALIAAYASLDSSEKREALNTLLTRAADTRALLAAIDEKRIDRAAITAPLVRQLLSFQDPKIEAWVKKEWGAVRSSSADKQKEIVKYKEFLTADLILRAEPSRGRALFAQSCQACHALHGVGGKIGPELPGAFEDVDYLLQNIVDPNAMIGKDYQQTLVTTKDGRVLSGIVSSEDPTALGLKTLGDAITLPRAEIAEVKVSDLSMMPEGLISAMSEDDVRDLFLYLRQREQVPVLATPANVNDFFNAVDLTGWRVRAGEWRVENGAIVGHGDGSRPATLVSDMLLKDFRFTARVRLAAPAIAAEIAFRGGDGKRRFQGAALGFGGRAPANVWTYRGARPESVAGEVTVAPDTWVSLEIVAVGSKARVSLDGRKAFELEDLPGAPRSLLAFYMLGNGALLAVKDAKVELDPKW